MDAHDLASHLDLETQDVAGEDHLSEPPCEDMRVLGTVALLDDLEIIRTQADQDGVPGRQAFLCRPATASESVAAVAGSARESWQWQTWKDGRATLRCVVSESG